MSMSDKIQFVCPDCSHQVQVSPAVIGKRGKCPGCGQIVRITAPGQTSPPQQQPSSIPQLQTQQPQQKSPEELKRAAAEQYANQYLDAAQDEYLAAAKAKEGAKAELAAAQAKEDVMADLEHAQFLAAEKRRRRNPTRAVTEEYREFLGNCATVADRDYKRGAVNCAQCSNNFGGAVLLDGTRIKCPNCGIFVELPVSYTDYHLDFDYAFEEEEKRKRNYMQFGSFSLLAIVLVYCLRYTGAGHWSNMVVKIGIGASVCVALVFLTLNVLPILRNLSD